MRPLYAYQVNDGFGELEVLSGLQAFNQEVMSGSRNGLSSANT